MNEENSFSKVIAPGDTLDFECPNGKKTDFLGGETIPSKEDPGIFISKVSGTKFTVAPLKEGVQEFSYSCDGEEFKAALEVPNSDSNNLPERNGPLDLVNSGVTFTTLIALLIIALILILFGVFIKTRNKKRAQTKLSKTLEIKKTPKQLLALFTKQVELYAKDKNRGIEKDIYQKGYRSVRSYLEHSLRLKTQMETTSQFLGSLKVLGPAKGLSSKTIADVERVLLTADNNRFSTTNINNSEDAKAFAKLLLPLLKIISTIDNQEQK